MAKLKTIILLIIMVSLSISYSQGGNYYVSGLELPRSISPVKDMESSFIYRTSNGKKKSFYLVKISDLMLKEKSLYRWPTDFKDELKATSILSDDSKGNNEILDFIYNEKLILTESKYAFLKVKSKYVKLEKVDYIGVSLIGSEKQSFYIPKSNGEYELKKGPLFQYSVKNSTNKILAVEGNKVPKWIVSAAKQREYLVLNPTLETMVQLPPLEKVPEYNASMELVNEAYQNQKNIDLAWIDSTLKFLIDFPLKSDDENPQKYESRKNIQKLTIERVMANLLPEGWESKRYALYEQRLEVQKVVQEKSKIIDNLSVDKRSLLIDQWWQSSLLLRSRTLIAGHLEKSVVEEAPSQLWGQDLFLDYNNKIAKYLYWNLGVGGGYTSWKTKESDIDPSSQYWYGLKLGFVIPIFIGVNNSDAPYSGGGLSLRLGSVSRNAHTEIKGGESREFDELSTGMYTALDFNFWAPGCGFGVEYEYLSDKFGEIGLTIHLPIYSWRN